jgi:hypothetical protein
MWYNASISPPKKAHMLVFAIATKGATITITKWSSFDAQLLLNLKMLEQDFCLIYLLAQTR